MSLIQSSSLPHATGFAIFHPAPSSSLSTWTSNVYNQRHLDSSSGFCQTAPPQPQSQARRHRHSAASNHVNQTASSSDFQVIKTSVLPVPQPLFDDTYHHQSLANMAEYGHEQMSHGFVQFGQPYVTGPPNTEASLAVSQYSPPLSHQPLSHSRHIAIPTSAHQPVPLQVAHSNDMNGYHAHPPPGMYARHSGSIDASASGQSMLTVSGDMDNGRVMYEPLSRGVPVRYQAPDQTNMISPVALGPWPLEEQPRHFDPGYAVPPTPLMEGTLIPIEQDGWQSQEPARVNMRAQVANMTESERLERRREQNRVSQAKLRRSRDEQYERVCREKANLENAFGQFRHAYAAMAEELKYWQDKELQRINTKRSQKGEPPYVNFPELAEREKEIANAVKETLKRQRQLAEYHMGTTSCANGESAGQPQELRGGRRRSSDEHSHSGVSEQIDQAPGSSGTNHSATSATVQAGRSENTQFAFSVGASQAPGSQVPTVRNSAQSTPKKTVARPRKNSKATPSKKPNKKRPTSQRSEDTSELTNSMHQMDLPVSEDYNSLQSPMDGSIQSVGYGSMPVVQDNVSYFSLRAPDSEGHYTR